MAVTSLGLIAYFVWTGAVPILVFLGFGAVSVGMTGAGSLLDSSMKGARHQLSVSGALRRCRGRPVPAPSASGGPEPDRRGRTPLIQLMNGKSGRVMLAEWKRVRDHVCSVIRFELPLGDKVAPLGTLVDRPARQRRDGLWRDATQALTTLLRAR